MQKLFNVLSGMPVWLLVLIELLLVAAVGYVDYLTGDYSVLIFYAIPLALAAWSHGDWGAILISVASGCARYISDFCSYSNSNVRYFNSISDMLFLIIIGLMISVLKRLIAEDKRDVELPPCFRS